MEPGKVFVRPGQVSIVDLSGFYSYNTSKSGFETNKNDTTTDLDAQRFSAKLYADISLSYPETFPKSSGDLEDHVFHVEQLGPAEWRYRVNLPHFTPTWPLFETTRLTLNQSSRKWTVLEESLLEATAGSKPLRHVRPIILYHLQRTICMTSFTTKKDPTNRSSNLGRLSGTPFPHIILRNLPQGMISTLRYFKIVELIPHVVHIFMLPSSCRRGI